MKKYRPAARGAELALHEAMSAVRSSMHPMGREDGKAGDDPDGGQLAKRALAHAESIQAAVHNWRTALAHAMSERNKG